MKLFFAIGLCFISLATFGQADSVSLKSAMASFDKALLTKDENTLRGLVDKDVSYGHSNGWVQNKKDIIADMKSGKLAYTKIENNSVNVVALGKKFATVRMNTDAEGTANGTAFQLKLHVLQVWINTKKGWELLARQSTKL